MRSAYTHIQILQNNLSIISLAYDMQSMPLVIYFKLRLCVLCFFVFCFYIRWGRDIYIWVGGMKVWVIAKISITLGGQGWRLYVLEYI